MEPMEIPYRWWPEVFGNVPDLTGVRKQKRYAVFRRLRRLVLAEGAGNFLVFDTGDYRISRVQLRDTVVASSTFTSQHGKVDLQTLSRV